MTGNRERLTLACFVAGALLAGGNGVSIRFSNRELSPLWGAGLRFSLAAALLLVVMAVLRLPFPRGRALTGALLYGALNFGAAFASPTSPSPVHAGRVRPSGLGPLSTLLLPWRNPVAPALRGGHRHPTRARRGNVTPMDPDRLVPLGCYCRGGQRVCIAMRRYWYALFPTSPVHERAAMATSRPAVGRVGARRRAAPLPQSANDLGFRRLLSWSARWWFVVPGGLRDCAASRSASRSCSSRS